MTMGQGACYVQESETKDEQGAQPKLRDEVVGSMIWTKNFLESQGYPIDENILYQDSRSAILLESNGCKSVGPRSRHLNICLLFITYKQ
jgi:hypothetical protein